jgi:nucleotide-binding universal stress UspA family protein
MAPAREVERILHPTDLSAAVAPAFYHALRLALACQAELTLLHVDRAGLTPWADFPQVRATLERWGILPPGSPHSALDALNLTVRKVEAELRRPAYAVFHYLKERPEDLIVLAAHRRSAAAIFSGGVGGPLARHTSVATLFLPEGVEGFVAAETGAVTLGRVVIVVHADAGPIPAVALATSLARALGVREVEFTLLHVEAEPLAPRPEEQEPGWSWKPMSERGDVAKAVLAAAQAGPADLIVIPTAGRRRLTERFRGSPLQRVLRGAPCPVLAVPER